jgi:phosphonoacetaldehyde hydrolase
MTKRLEAVIFDWAGTMVDYGSLAPVRAVTALFARHGIRLTDDEVRRDMGIFKKDHIRRILQQPRIAGEWRDKTNSVPGEDDVEKLFTEFNPLQMEILEEYSQLIPGSAEISEELQRRGLRVGSTTGYTRPMLDVLVARAASAGYQPDSALCPDDVEGGRPLPWMCLKIALLFRLSGVAAAVKVGDTVSDIQEGLNAGMWTVGVAATGNEVGLSAADLAALSPDDRTRRSEAARETLRHAGAHYVVDSVRDLLPVLQAIDVRLASGKRP